MGRRVMRAGAVGALVAALVTVAGCAGSSAPAPTTPASASGTNLPASASGDRHPSAPTTNPPKPKPWPESRVSQAIKRIRSSAPGVAVSVAVLNTASGKSYTYGKTSNMWTASVYKLFILEVLLHERSGALSSYEMANATRAIENSDNVAGYSLFLDAGGNAGLANGFSALGLRHTVPGVTDPTFTRTSAQDCLTLLRHLVQNGPLDQHSRDYTLSLMRQVEADQRWGVGVVADHGNQFANKNGWLSLDDSNGPGEDDDGLWVVNSVGVVKVHGQQLLMAVLSKHNSDMESGVHLIQRIAKSAVKAVVAQG